MMRACSPVIQKGTASYCKSFFPSFPALQTKIILEKELFCSAVNDRCGNSSMIKPYTAEHSGANNIFLSGCCTLLLSNINK